MKAAVFGGPGPLQLQTPALVVDLERLEANLREMQAFADAQGVRLRQVQG